jgi:hypothetical protein
MDLYIHSPIRLHGVVLNYLSTGTTLPFTVVKYLLWRFSLFLIKLSLDNPFHLESTENTTTEPGINAAIVPKTVRVKRGGAVKAVSSLCP